MCTFHSLFFYTFFTYSISTHITIISTADERNSHSVLNAVPSQCATMVAHVLCVCVYVWIGFLAANLGMQRCSRVRPFIAWKVSFVSGIEIMRARKRFSFWHSLQAQSIISMIVCILRWSDHPAQVKVRVCQTQSVCSSLHNSPRACVTNVFQSVCTEPHIMLPPECR